MCCRAHFLRAEKQTLTDTLEHAGKGGESEGLQEVHSLSSSDGGRVELEKSATAKDAAAAAVRRT